MEELQRWNRIENPDLVQIGQAIVVYKAVDAPESSASQGAVSQAAPGPEVIVGFYFLTLLLFLWGAIFLLFRRKHGAAPKENRGERFVRRELERRYGDWMLLNDVMLPSGQGTTQIDHILVSPGGVVVIETKDMNGWVFGSPGQKQWTQSFAAGHWYGKAGIKSKQFKFYNPLLQNEGHAKALVNRGIVDWWWLRPIVVFVETRTENAGQIPAV